MTNTTHPIKRSDHFPCIFMVADNYSGVSTVQHSVRNTMGEVEDLFKYVFKYRQWYKFLFIVSLN